MSSILAGPLGPGGHKEVSSILAGPLGPGGHKEVSSILADALCQGVTKRCRLSWLTNNVRGSQGDVVYLGCPIVPGGHK